MAGRLTTALVIHLALGVVACSPPKPAREATDTDKPTGIVGAWENNKWGKEICFFFCPNGKAFMLVPTCNDREDATEYRYTLDGTDMTLSQGDETVFTPTVEFADDDTVELDLTAAGTPTELERADHTMTLCDG